MILDFGMGEGLEFEGEFKFYGNREQLLNIASQMKKKAVHINKGDYGWVDISPDDEPEEFEIKPWKESEIFEEEPG